MLLSYRRQLAERRLLEFIDTCQPATALGLLGTNHGEASVGRWPPKAALGVAISSSTRR